MRASSLPLLGRDELLTELVGRDESLRHGIGRIAFVDLQAEAVRIALGPLDPQAILALAGDVIGGERPLVRMRKPIA